MSSLKPSRGLLSALLVGVLAAAGLTSLDRAGAAEIAAMNYSPTSRTVRPVAVFRTTGSVTNPQGVLTNQATRLTGANSSITLDFGKETGGIATLSFGATSGGQQLGLSFTESSLYVGTASDISANYGQPEGALTASAGSGGSYTMPRERLRGGFRYMTIFLRTSGWVDLTGVSLAFTAAPGKANPAAYANYFTSNDELLNRIWLAGAYTVQLNTIASNEGRVWPPPSQLWNNSATVGVGQSVMVDGAKRDRTIWPADLGIATPSAYAYDGETVSTRNALTTMLQAQSSAGEIPWSGPPFNLTGSDTYHLWTLLMSSTYYSYTGDTAWLNSVWPRFRLAMDFITAKINGNNLLNVTRTQDWARFGQGGENISANALMYGTLIGASRLAAVRGDTNLAATWTQLAAALKAAVNARLWVPSQGMYRDNPSSNLYPQDGNSLAVTLGLTDSEAKSISIARKMSARWGYLGATTPEWGVNGFHPFASALEVNAHFMASQDHAGLAEIRKLWGYMLDSPIGTASTFWEGLNSDGGFGYSGEFTSLAHGWSAGPTSALTFHVLGTAPESTLGQYRFVPHPGDLTAVSGRITMPQGRVEASWTRNPTAGTYDAQLTAPAGTTGRIGIPKLGGNPTVTVGGATVWSNGIFTPRPGIAGGSQDANYIYLTGVAPGSYGIAATGLGNSPPPPAVDAGLPAGFTRCAGEGGQCTFTGNRVVAYGAGTYSYKIASSATPCTTTAFGGNDPAANLLKSCFVAPEGGPIGWSLCAAENQTCGNLSNGRNVAYGANGAFYTMIAKTSIACSNASFGDSFDRLGKSCYVAPAGAPAGGWTQCATEGGACSAANGQLVAYGAYGSFIYKTVTGNANCNNATFGEPVSGEVKACYTKTGGPNGFTSHCATEGGTCMFSGVQTVAYGARGVYVFITFTGSAPCTNAAFGSDPLHGVQKSCYLVA
ncbi:MAG TPA: alpha-L-rhamnosidase [Micromonosporaceae bacterium]|nr:alpha-L-rhamnosidase [Micromonosporaceae bacterium]